MEECGIDEAGRGPLIGPMVMAILCGNRKELEDIGVADSKKLSPQRREQLFVDLQAFNHSFVVINPSEIDEYVEHKKLNELEEKYASNLAGIPGVSTPAGLIGDVPVGMQWLGPALKETRLLQIAQAFEQLWPSVPWPSVGDE